MKKSDLENMLEFLKYRIEVKEQLLSDKRYGELKKARIDGQKSGLVLASGMLIELLNKGEFNRYIPPTF